MIVIFGLGNIGNEYEKTYHNTGFIFLDNFAKKYGFKFTKTKYNGMVAEGNINGEKVMLVKPTTYMNLSGKCVREYVNKFKLDLQNILVIYDDIDIACGTYRLRKSGSAGTHNGMRNIIQELNSENFARLRIGIGFKPEYMGLADYVLSRISNDNMQKIESLFDFTNQIIEQFIQFKDVEKIHIKWLKI